MLSRAKDRLSGSVHALNERGLPTESGVLSREERGWPLSSRIESNDYVICLARERRR